MAQIVAARIVNGRNEPKVALNVHNPDRNQRLNRSWCDRCSSIANDSEGCSKDWCEGWTCSTNSAHQFQTHQILVAIEVLVEITFVAEMISRLHTKNISSVRHFMPFQLSIFLLFPDYNQFQRLKSWFLTSMRRSNSNYCILSAITAVCIPFIKSQSDGDIVTACISFIQIACYAVLHAHEFLHSVRNRLVNCLIHVRFTANYDEIVKRSIYFHQFKLCAVLSDCNTNAEMKSNRWLPPSPPSPPCDRSFSCGFEENENAPAQPHSNLNRTHT